MTSEKKILIIAPFAFGYTAHIQKALQKDSLVEASILYLDHPKFKYRNVLHKAQNFISKIFLGKNLKKTFVSDRLIQGVSKMGAQDIIFIIRPDLLDDTTLKFIKRYTQKFIAYYYDSTRRFPRKVEIISFFDGIYSYDKEDVATYNLQFLTNYIFEESNKSNYKYQFFNISTNCVLVIILNTSIVYLISSHKC